jgi:hypothetical protein
MGEDRSEHAGAKRAAARAIAEYSQQGRVYAQATSILFHYLERELDPRTHCYLHAAIDRGLAVRPPALAAGARVGDGMLVDQPTWEALIPTEKARLKADTRSTDTADCATTPGPLPALQPRTSEYRQYLDVDCGRENVSRPSRIPVDSGLAAQYRVISATAVIQEDAPCWLAVRNVSGPQIKAEGTIKQQAHTAAAIYEAFGSWSSLCSATSAGA